MRLKTFVHISDLHFGDIDPNTHGLVYDAGAPAIWANFKYFDGLLGHSYRALEYLEDFFVRMRDSEDAQLIVTGDLTCVGKGTQFDTANEYLSDVLRPPKGNHRGLSVTDWKNCAVPGNHDHWPGLATIFGPPTPRLARDFKLPFVGAQITLPNGVHLSFIGINTDADVSPASKSRLLARGRFDSQLTNAANLMGAPSRDEIRVLLMHHSYLYNSTKHLVIEPASRQALEQFLVDQDIAVILCGHTHSPNVEPFVASAQHYDNTLLEARCGTTTQMHDFPSHWKTFRGKRPKRKLDQNSLLVHRLLEENGKVIWHTETYRRFRLGFQKATPGPNELLEDRLEVWPR